MKKTSFKITTPHAAVKIWNYVDRLPAEGATASLKDVVKEEIISTISCTSIQTQKAKADPVGTFHFVLAPTRNWTAVITPGSWCVVMMSNEPIAKEDFVKANPKLIKMIGKIDSVRTQVSTNPDGGRVTQFFVSGKDWGQIFNDTLYIDPLIMDPSENSNDQGNSLYAQLVHVIQRPGTPQLTTIRNNLQVLLEVFGKPLRNIEGKIDRLGKNTHSPRWPTQMMNFFGFSETEILKNITLISGALQSEKGYNENAPDGLGWIDPFSLVGSHNLWQVMQDNSNYCLNEMFTDILWKDNQAQFALFNRIKPFAFRDQPLDQKSVELRSLFKYVPVHELDNVSITTVNAGTNWRDKYNFLEVKPEIAEFKVFENWVKQKSQVWDRSNENAVFDREGFRPLIFSVKQLPFKTSSVTVSTGNSSTNIDHSSNQGETPVPSTPAIEVKPEGETVQGFYQGKAFDLTVVNVNGAIVAEQAAEDTRAWFAEAAQAGLQWDINSSFRTMDHQIRLQSDPDAALPGRSPHQSGRGLDIQPKTAAAGRVHSSTVEGASILAQLDVIGQKYGWERDVVREPWHFTYKKWVPNPTALAKKPTIDTALFAGATASDTATATSSSSSATQTDIAYNVDMDAITKWTALLQEWYFDTHRLLNGHLTMTGSTDYITVGNNIMFDAALLGVKINLNAAAAKTAASCFVLAHVEAVTHSFQVNDDGSRTFQTAIDFVRGIIVDKQKNLIGSGVLDSLSTELATKESANDTTVIMSADSSDPGQGA